jgi:hypothetical protein
MKGSWPCDGRTIDPEESPALRFEDLDPPDVCIVGVQDLTPVYARVTLQCRLGRTGRLTSRANNVV